MGYLLAGLAALLLALVAANGFAKANPSVLARIVRGTGGVIALAAAVFLAVRGAFGYAAPLAALGVWLLSATQSPVTPRGNPASGRTSQVRTQTLEMTLDLDTGAISGEILRGPYAGQQIDALTPAQIAEIWSECRYSDPQSAQILEAYLDREHSGWREHAGASGTGGDDGSGERRRRDGRDAPAGNGPMSVEEACDVLGVSPNASEEEIARAHRTRMMQNHPDRGGSTYLAAKINEAKSVLLAWRKR